jgi:hypothetical protein
MDEIFERSKVCYLKYYNNPGVRFNCSFNFFQIKKLKFFLQNA